MRRGSSFDAGSHLSKRMRVIADMVRPGSIPADIGTDHGWLPVYLLQTGKCSRALAMDLRPGPLERAKSHVDEAGLSSKIILRLSDGMDELKSGEADGLIISGMGGNVMRNIVSKGLSRGLLGIDKIRDAVFQPQSDMRGFFRYIVSNGFVIRKESIIFEDGKYYFFAYSVFDPDEAKSGRMYGYLMAEEGHPLFREYLIRRERTVKKILSDIGMASDENSGAMARKEKFLSELLEIRKLMDIYNKEGDQNECWEA